MNIKLLTRNDRIGKALTGLTVREVEALAIEFEWNLKETYIKLTPERKRKLGGGMKSQILPDSFHKFVFILIYLKTYPTYDVLAFFLGFDRSRSCRWVKFLLPVLEMTLKRKLVLPKRRIGSVEEFIQLFPEVKDVFIDGTERRVQKPVNKKRRNKLYSGKKKATTRKNVIVSDEKRKILVLTPTKSGRRHDKRLTDKAHLARSIPDEVTIWNDTGLKGIEHTHTNTMLPKKRTKKHPLTDAEKEENRLISGIRVIGEHAIGGMKRMKAASDIYRNHRPNLDDTFMFLSSGLWNYHLAYHR